jgi:YVTN family beta-propeller protein
MRRWRLWLGLALVASVVGAGCHKSTTVGLTVAPTTATVLINNTAQFEGAVTGSTATVLWSVNSVSGGNTTVGTINSVGLYTAPATVPNPTSVTITGTVSGTSVTATATVTIQSGVQVSVAPTTFTVGTGESFPFVASVIGVPVNAVTSACNSSNTTSGLPPCTAVTWSVTPPTVGGSVGATTGIYTAPGTLPSASNSTASNVVTVTATSVFDTTQTASAIITLVAHTDPTLSSVGPNTGARGAVFQDVYLTGTNFISTTNVFINGVQVPTQDILVSSVTCATLVTTNSSGTSIPIPPCTSASLTAGSTVLRVRIPDIFLANALTLPSTNSVSLTFTAARQGGTPQPCAPNATACQLVLSPERPVITGSTPDSIAQGGGSPFSFSVNGGFYGTPLNPVVTGLFSGQPIFPSISSTNPDRQLNVTVPANAAAQAGLYEVGVKSDTSGIPAATKNLAIQTQYTSSPTATATLPVGTLPQSVAINSATGIAAVVNQTSNDVYLIDLTQATPVVVAKICTAAVTGATEPTCPPAGPTGVAIDNLQNIALVTNSTNNTIAVVDLAQRKVTQILTPGTILNNASVSQVPVAVGVNPVTGRALVAYQGTNFGVLLDTANLSSATLNTATCSTASVTVSEPQCIVGVVNISTGASPRIAVSPKLNWALVTPGSLGSLAIVNLSQQSTNAIANATRSNGIVTVNTSTTHTLQVGQPVLITGLSDATLNGLNTVISVPSSTTFTFTQSSTLPGTPTPVMGTSATAFYGVPIATVATSLTTTGVAINDQTSKAFLTDPAINGTAATVFSVLDQSSFSLSSSALPATGTIGAAFNPLTNIAVTVNETNNTGYVVDPTAPTILASFPVGHTPKDVAIDAGSNLAVVVNQGDNTVSIVPLGVVRTPQVLQISPAQIYVNSTLTTGVSTVGLPSTITIIGKGFTGASVARLDGVALTTASFTDRLMTVNLPNSMLTTAHEFTLDVSNAGVISNAASLQVIQAVSVTGFGCAATPAPTGVAIDAPNNLAVVTDPSCNEVYLVNLATGTGQIVSVGTSPLGVAVTPQGGFAAVANTGSNNVSFIDDLNADVTATISTDANPSGVAIDPVLGEVVVTASGAGSVDIFSITSGNATQVVATPVQQGPVPVAVDPVLHVAAVGNESSNTVSLVSLVAGGTTALQTPSVSLPTDIAYEPISDQFIVASSVNNQIEVMNPNTASITPVRVGINPTSIAYNFATSTLVTTNTVGQNMTVVDFVTGTVRQVFPLSSSGQFSVALHPLTNMAVVADAANSRILFVPIP